VAEVTVEVKLTDEGLGEEHVRPGGDLFVRETVPAKPYRPFTDSVSWTLEPDVVTPG